MGVWRCIDCRLTTRGFLYSFLPPVIEDFGKDNRVTALSEDLYEFVEKKFGDS